MNSERDSLQFGMTNMSANRDQQIAEAIAEYLAAYDIGKPPDRSVFLAKYPELADSLEKLLDR